MMFNIYEIRGVQGFPPMKLTMPPDNIQFETVTFASMPFSFEVVAVSEEAVRKWMKQLHGSASWGDVQIIDKGAYVFLDPPLDLTKVHEVDRIHIAID